MELAARMMTQALEESQSGNLDPSPTTSSAMVDEELSHYEVTWRRLVILGRIANMHAQSGMVLMEVEAMRNRMAEEARLAYNRSFGVWKAK